MRAAETLQWPGGEHPFRLDIGALRTIERLGEAGCSVVLMRLIGGTWKADDVIAVLRLGLVGGGMDEKQAAVTIERALNGASLYALAVPAAEVMRRALMWEDDQPGEALAGEGQTRTRFPTDEPAGPASSASAPRSD